MWRSSLRAQLKPSSAAAPFVAPRRGAEIVALAPAQRLAVFAPSDGLAATDAAGGLDEIAGAALAGSGGPRPVDGDLDRGGHRPAFAAPLAALTMTHLVIDQRSRCKYGVWSTFPVAASSAVAILADPRARGGWRIRGPAGRLDGDGAGVGGVRQP